MQRTLDSQALHFFRIFLSLKIAAPYLFPLGAPSIPYIALVLVASLPRYYLSGLVGILILSAKELVETWPLSINHNALEMVILALLCLYPSESKGDSPKTYPSCNELIQWLMVSVWVYSGIHKLLDSYYWNGEFFALEVLSDASGLGHKLGLLIQQVGIALPIQAPLACCSVLPFANSPAFAGFLLLLAWATVLTEIILPWGLFLPKVREYTLLALFIFQANIAYFSGEIDFAFTAFAILLLFVPRIARVAYPIHIGLMLVVQPWLT